MRVADDKLAEPYFSYRRAYRRAGHASSVRQHFQIYSPLRPLCQLKQVSCEATMGRGERKCLGDLGHMTKMAAKLIYDKYPSRIFSKAKGLIELKLGI